jgi:hypothetical protein
VQATFDKEKLERDVLSAISRAFADGREFTGHDGRLYLIRGVDRGESESESFIDVIARGERDTVTAKYAIVLQRISR